MYTQILDYYLVHVHKTRATKGSPKWQLLRAAT